MSGKSPQKVPKSPKKLEKSVDLSDGISKKPYKLLRELYGQLAKRLNDPTLKVSPILEKLFDENLWKCTLELKWPSKRTFVGESSTQKDALKLTAFGVFIWLRQEEHVTRDGSPFIFEETEPLSAIKEILYSNPVSVLHNYFNIVSTAFENFNLAVHPIFELDAEQRWSCSYVINWPQVKVFSSRVNCNKKVANEEAALSALMWLKGQDRVNNKGFPIISKKKEKKSSERVLKITARQEKCLQKIIEIYNNQFLKYANLKELTVLKQPETQIQSKQFFSTSRKKYVIKNEIKLPITDYKNEILKLVNENNVVIIKGEPGCGKSTRVPQYILENWAKTSTNSYFKIAVTQPRRIAAITLAERVAREQGEKCGKTVGYQIRLNNVCDRKMTRILYCTNGILLQHFYNTGNIAEFTHVVVDEAHEREVNTDILLLLLKTTLKTNPKLKIIIMSATIDTDLFQNYFSNAPVINIPGFTYPVQSYFVDQLPTSLNLVKTIANSNNLSPPLLAHEEVGRLIEYIDKTKEAGAVLCFLPGWSDICKIRDLIGKNSNFSVLCLHSKISDYDQKLIFQPAEQGVRKIILSTNIAETSVTIDDVVFVIDAGMHNESCYDNIFEVNCVDVQWISQASMLQRKGRAGRVQCGESYHMFTKKKAESLALYTDAEILRINLDKIILDLKVYFAEKRIEDIMSELITPPDPITVYQAIRSLKQLELLDSEENATDLGKIVAKFSLEPKLAKILINSVIFKCVIPIVDIVTIYSSEVDMFSNSLVSKEIIRKVKEETNAEQSDHLALMLLFEAWLEKNETDGEKAVRSFCEANNLVHENLMTAENLRNIHLISLYDGLFTSFTDANNDFALNNELIKGLLFASLEDLLYEDLKQKKQKFLLNKHFQKVIVTSNSLNCKRKNPSNLFIYMNEVCSKVRNVNTVRDCSAIAPLTMLLFSSKDLLVTEENDDLATIRLGGSNIEFSTNIIAAKLVEKCRNIIRETSKNVLNEVIQTRYCSDELEQIWDLILNQLNQLLTTA